MHRYRPRMIVAAVLLAALAGFVDAITYLSLSGFFASFMSGNTTRLGVGVATGDYASVRTAGALLCAFLCGVMIATMLAVRFARRRKPTVMLAVTLLLALAALLAGFTDRHYPLMLLAVAMGAENGVFNREGEVSIGLTYMTGTLVKLGQKLAAALIGSGGAFAWAPYFGLWLGFAVGAVLGGREFLALGHGALWAGAAASGALTLAVAALTWDQES
ncbi:MAG: YoaK family protein [Sphingomonas sp.]